MPLTLSSRATESMTLDAFVEYLEYQLDVSSTDDLIDAAPAFARLLNNRRLLADAIEAELRGWRDERSDHEYAGHTLVLVRRPKFLVRANIWVAPDPHRPAPRPEDPGFGYLIPHDHNFAFLTGGYTGPGYTTYLYDYDYDSITGRVGEPVDLQWLGTDTLPVGKMVLYRPSLDVHYQEHPTALSISLNVVVQADYVERTQYLFDLIAGTVRTAIDAPGERGATICELAAEVGDERTAGLLGEVVTYGRNPRLRVAAARALCALEPSSGPAALEQLRADDDSRVRSLAVS
jgi:hypothetical protein